MSGGTGTGTPIVLTAATEDIKNLLIAIYTHFTETAGGVHNNFYNDVAGRLFKGEAPEGSDFPYGVFFIVSNMPEYPGGHTIEQVLLQVSLFSSASSSVEIEDMLSHLRALFDDCTLAITGSTLIFFIRENMTTMRDEITTSAGTVGVWHYIQEHSIWTV